MTRISLVRATIVTLTALGLLAAEASAGTITVHTPTTPPKVTVHPPSPQWGVGRGITIKPGTGTNVSSGGDRANVDQASPKLSKGLTDGGSKDPCKGCAQ